MNLPLTLALRDLRGGFAGLRLLAVCLFLGVAALAGVGSLSTAITSELALQGQSILGGDVEMEIVQRTADDAERAAFAAAGDLSETIRMRAMASRPDGSQAALAELKGVDGVYPLYGQFRLAPGALAPRPAGRDVAIAPALAERLQVKPGDPIRIGDAELRVIGLIAEEPDRVGEGFTFGPVALVDMDGLKATGLVQPGSLYTTRYRIRLADGVDAGAVAKRLADRFPSAGWEVQDRTNAAPGTRRFIGRLGQFLMLVGLTALAVAGIGVGNGVTSYLEGKRGAIATLKALGASSRTIFLSYLIQIGLIAGAGIVAGLVAGSLVPLAVVAVAGDALPVQPRFAVHPGPLALAALYGVLITLLFVLAPLARARAVTAASLFRGGVEGAARPTGPVIAAIGLTLTAIVALAVGTARDPLFAAMFVGAAAGLLLLLTALGWLVRRVAAGLPRSRRPLVRLAVANLHRPGAQTGRLVVALGLGLTLFATLAVVETNLSGQIRSTVPAKAPSFFALDIPVEDKDRFLALVAAQAPGAEVKMVASLRGPVVSFGGKRVAELKELPEGAWILRGDRGLTYAATPPEGSRIVAGKWWPADYQGPPLVSLDLEAARALGLGIGDEIIVSVLGVEVPAKIASLREIKWDTMGFNFVLVYSPGVLEGAPHSYMATIAMPETGEVTLNRAITQAFPSVSLIRVKEVIGQVAGVLGQLSTAVRAAASVALAAGIAVLVGAIAASRRARIYDSVLLKLLGATRGQVLAAQAIEYAVLALILSILAAGIGAAAGWYVVTRVFELDWATDWRVVGVTLAIGGFGTLALGLLGSLPALAARPARALRAL
ncbi:putative ABC transport system permease protein [Sphingomonas laterariae]|uniref:Putative ABC transport system permease protein n=1 Tax=Edaphosphingomonas laterariae TaxID=861865 RepID=A0A239EF37_9SPHN|nr:FtsX-like permease family protein [Sphingomonas laterariae]SNS43275.1 putative ABC transport system permease protein [Sphingomonas laterariae]